MRMQLKKTSIRHKLAIATSSLLIATPVKSHDTQDATHSINNSLAFPFDISGESDINVSGLYYSEENRVKVTKNQSKINKQINEKNKIKVNVIYDTMSGASPNGRIYIDNKQSETVTQTTASGFSFDVANLDNSANKTWLTEFEDTRIATSLDWEFNATNRLTTVLSAGMSTEDDYEAYTGSGKFLFDFNQRRSTLTMGAAISNDTVKAGGGIPKGLGPLHCEDVPAFHPDWLNCDSQTQPVFFGPANKIVKDYLVGITQVLNRRTIIQFNYALGIEDGYLTDPYKQVSVFKSDYGESAILYEKRPDSRTTNSLFFKFVNVPIDNISLNFSYRYFWDDWEVDAHTVDGRLRLNLGSKFYIQGHGRLHVQSSAFFFEKSINMGSSKYAIQSPNYLSADSRLAKIIGATAGVKLGYKINELTSVSARVEHMQQHYYHGVLPRLKVWIAQLILNIKF